MTAQHRGGAYRSNAIKRRVGGIVFDSLAEARWYQDLQLRELAGDISDLKPHPKFVIQPEFYVLGEKRRAITYAADMEYIEDGVRVIVDVKAFKWTPKRTKRVPVRAEFNRTRSLFEYSIRDKLNSGEWRYEVVDSINI